MKARGLSFALVACLVLSQVSSQIVAQENSEGIQVTPDSAPHVAVPEQTPEVQPQELPAVPPHEAGIQVAPQGDEAYLYANKDQEDFANASRNFDVNVKRSRYLAEPIPKGKARVSCIEAKIDLQRERDPYNDFAQADLQRFEASIHFFGDNEFWLEPFEQPPGEMTPEGLDLRHKQVLSQLQQQRGQIREKAVTNGIYAMAYEIGEQSPYYKQSQLAANKLLQVHFMLELNPQQQRQRQGLLRRQQTQGFTEEQVRGFLADGQIDQRRIAQAWEAMRRELNEQYPDPTFLAKYLNAIGEVNRPLDNHLRARAKAALEPKIFVQTRFIPAPAGKDGSPMLLMQKTVRAHGQVLSDMFCW